MRCFFSQKLYSKHTWIFTWSCKGSSSTGLQWKFQLTCKNDFFRTLQLLQNSECYNVIWDDFPFNSFKNYTVKSWNFNMDRVGVIMNRNLLCNLSRFVWLVHRRLAGNICSPVQGEVWKGCSIIHTSCWILNESGNINCIWWANRALSFSLCCIKLSQNTFPTRPSHCEH